MTGSVMMVIAGAVSFRVTVLEVRGSSAWVQTVTDHETFIVAVSDLHPVEAR